MHTVYPYLVCCRVLRSACIHLRVKRSRNVDLQPCLVITSCAYPNLQIAHNRPAGHPSASDASVLTLTLYVPQMPTHTQLPRVAYMFH